VLLCRVKAPPPAPDGGPGAAAETHSKNISAGCAKSIMQKDYLDVHTDMVRGPLDLGGAAVTGDTGSPGHRSLRCPGSNAYR
jgi:hypothetical protein